MRKLSIILVAVILVALSLVGFGKAYGYGGSGPTLTPRAAAPIITLPANTPAVANARVFARNLYVGSRNNDVKALQEILKSAGFYKGIISGYYNNTTKLAVRAYQKMNGLRVTGLVNAQTRQLLNGVPTPAAVQTRAAMIAKLQSQLQALIKLFLEYKAQQSV